MKPMFQNTKEAELNVHPKGIILLETHVTISFCNNIKNITIKSVKLDTQEGSCSSIEQGSVLLDRNLLITENQIFSTNNNNKAMPNSTHA